MNPANSFRRFGVLLIAFAMLFTIASQAWGAENSAAPALDIRLKLGSKVMTVNGTASAVAAPFQKGGVTYIPLGAFTKGLGAKLSMQQNKVLTLTLGNRKLVLTLGSKTAVADGKSVALQAAPASLAGGTMVPLAAVKYLDATYTFTESTKEIRIVAASQTGSAPTAGTGGIDADAGKTKIGDSYFQWSMNYPTGLAQTYQSTDGSSLEFGDVKKEYYLGVFVTTAYDKLSSLEIRDKVLTYYYDTETTVSKTTVTAAGSSYESILTKDKNGLYYEYRAFQANDYLYIVAFGKKVSGPSQLKQASGILDSFKPIFDASDAHIKDLTQVVEGYKTLKYDDYGLSLQLPKDWELAEKANFPYYEPKDGSAYFYVDVTSLEQGDTMNAWVERRMARLKSTFDAPYYKELERTQVTWNGVPAVMQKLSYSNDTKTWWDEYELYAIQGKYRYYGEFSFLQSRKTEYETTLARLLKTTQIDFRKIEANFGDIVDDGDMLDRTAVTSKTSRKYGYSVALPQYWTAVKSDFESDQVVYSYYGGSFRLDILDGYSNAQELYQEVENAYNQSAAKNKNEHIKENAMVPIAGVQAKRLVMEDDGTGENMPYRSTVYALYSGGRGYLITMNLSIANNSEFNKKRLEEVVNSFKLNA